jgi:plasmid stabilization system protein ParE
MKLIWSPEAIGDLFSLRAYISEDNPTAARRIALRIIRIIAQLLPENPHIGRPAGNARTSHPSNTLYRHPIGWMEIRCKYYVSIMARGAGRIIFRADPGFSPSAPSWILTGYRRLLLNMIR